MPTIVARIRKTIDALPPAGVISSAQLQHRLGNADQVKKTLGPIALERGLEKLRAGLYWRPYYAPLWQSPAFDLASLEHALQVQYDVELHRAGQWAAHRLGLAPEPPVATYDTAGRLSPVQIGHFQMAFRRVRPERIERASRPLGEVLNTIEWFLFENNPRHDSTASYLGVLLRCFSPAERARAMRVRRPAVRLFCETWAPAITYVTGWSALNVPSPDRGSADWHTEALIHSRKLIVAGEHLAAAPGLRREDLFDASAFLDEYGLAWPTPFCARPERALLDLLYHATFRRHGPPNRLALKDLLIDVDRGHLAKQIRSWRKEATSAQRELLNQWMTDNGLDT